MISLDLELDKIPPAVGREECESFISLFNFLANLSHWHLGLLDYKYPVFTSFSLFPGGLIFLETDLLLNLGLLVELVEVVDNDGDGQGNAQHTTQSASCKQIHQF